MMDFCPKKGKFFIFILGQYFSFFWIFVLSHIWLPRYEKTADFLAQMLFGSCIGSHWFQKLKNIQSDTQYLCKIPDIFSVSQPKCLLWSMIWQENVYVKQNYCIFSVHPILSMLYICHILESVWSIVNRTITSTEELPATIAPIRPKCWKSCQKIVPTFVKIIGNEL